MESVSLEEIIQWTDAEVVGILRRDYRPARISTDTRTLEEGDLFVALKGERFDGHDFVDRAFRQGACGAVVERRWASRDSGRLSRPLLIVDSPLKALGAVARHYRSRFDVPVVAVVGSSGKTTAKEMISTVLSTRLSVLKNAGNENNEIGVPKTLLQLSKTHEAVVLEMAARRRGDIRYLCSIARPTIGVLLNIGTAHLEFFGSVEGVANAKGELLEYLDESLTALVNADDRVVAGEVKRTKGRLLGFGLERESRFRGEGLVLDQEGCGHFSLQNVPFSLQIPGRHNVYNALAAAAVGRLLGFPWEDIQRAVNAFRPVAMRSHVLRRNGMRIIDDTYNANPDSVKAALRLLRDIAGRRKIAVLGDMLELGEQSPRLHAEIGRRVVEEGIDLLCAVGPMSEYLVRAAWDAGMPEENARHFGDEEEMVAYLRKILRKHDAVLVKASRAVGLDQVVERLC